MNKKQVGKQIKDFFKNKHSGREVKKIKKLAMRNQIKLGKLRKQFCKKCYSMNLRILSVKNNLKSVECKNCKYINRYKIN